MKLLPNIQLPQLPPVSATGGTTGMDSRITSRISLLFNPADLLWRYGSTPGFPSTVPPQQGPFLDFKTHLPTNLASDPRLWSRDDVVNFLRWAEQEFELPQIDMDQFQMNGKALCLLTKADLGERCPGAGDVLHNVLIMLSREINQLQRCLPSSPVTPTRPSIMGPAYPLSPHSHPSTPTWMDGQYAANIASLMSANSVTLSPAPSVDSQAGSPGHTEPGQAQVYRSDSDEDNQQANGTSPPATPTALTAQRLSEVCVKDQPSPTLTSPMMPLTPGAYRHGANGSVREFFPSDTPEPNTNGRLLWDFLQQLLNDPSQRYTHYIAWKSRETGVFKIVDPPGLARLWGIQKNHLSMNYDKMSRALRYYYRVNILKKVQGERHCYQFLRNPTELKNIKNISLLRQQVRIKSEPEEESASIEPEADMPTDLSMSTMNQSMSSMNQSMTTMNQSMSTMNQSMSTTNQSMSSMNQSISNVSPSMNELVNEPPPQPLSLLDPPVKYRSHAYNLVKTDQEAEERK